MKLNILLSTTSNLLICLPHNTFYIHDALFVNAVNKDKIGGLLNHIAHCTRLATEHWDIRVLYGTIKES